MGFDDVLNAIAERANREIKVEDCDYKVDGLWYCGKCNTPKQVKVPCGNGFIYPRCMCKCEQDKLAEQERREKEAKRARRIETQKRNNIVNEKLLKYTFAADKQPDSKYTAIFKRYCSKFDQIKRDNIGLILWGNTGVGKSFYAGCIANELIEQGIDVYATAEPRILNELFNTPDKAKYVQKLVSHELLIIDDFGTARNTSYAQEQIFTIIDERYKMDLPTIFTTNLPPSHFNQPNGIDEERVFERVKAMGQFIEIKGKNWRNEESAEKAERLLGVLNS